MRPRRSDPDLGVGRAPGTGPGQPTRPSGWGRGQLSLPVLIVAGVTVAILVALLVVALAGSGSESSLNPQQQQRLDQLTVGNGQALMRKLSH